MYAKQSGKKDAVEGWTLMFDIALATEGKHGMQ